MQVIEPDGTSILRKRILLIYFNISIFFNSFNFLTSVYCLFGATPFWQNGVENFF